MTHVVVIFREEAILKVLGPYVEPQAESIARIAREADSTLTVEVHELAKV